jgi:hypothetical protein
MAARGSKPADCIAAVPEDRLILDGRRRRAVRRPTEMKIHRRASNELAGEYETMKSEE